MTSRMGRMMVTVTSRRNGSRGRRMLGLHLASALGVVLLLILFATVVAVAAIPAEVTASRSTSTTDTSRIVGSDSGTVFVHSKYCGDDNDSASTESVIDDATKVGKEIGNADDDDDDDNEDIYGSDRQSQSQDSSQQQHHLLQDRHVASSPLSVAAICRDGIALISLHYDVETILPTSSSSVLLDSEIDDGVVMQQSDMIVDDGGDGDEVVETVIEIEGDAASAAASAAASSTTMINTNINTNIINTNVERGSDESILHATFCDLPLSFRGPLRIETIYENNHQQLHHQSQRQPYSSHYSSIKTTPPMSLLTAGWRADSITLANAGRELMAQEVRVYCLPTLSSSTAFSSSVTSKTSSDQNAIMIENESKKEEEAVSNGNVVAMSQTEQQQQQQQQHEPHFRPPIPPSTYHGRRIAEGLSYYLTKCAATASGGIGGGGGGSGNGIASRPLSCVGLLACGGSGGLGSGSGSSLHLIDSTGAYRVRAHAIGDAIRASKLHRRMMHVDFTNMDCHDGLRVLLRLIAELEEDGKGTKATRVKKEDEEKGRRPIDTCDNNRMIIEGKEQDNTSTILNNDMQASLQEDTISNSGGSDSIIAAAKGPAFVTCVDTPSLMQQQHQSSSSRGLVNIPSKYTAAVELAVLPCGEGRMRRVRLSSLFASPLAVRSVEGKIA